MGQPAGRSSAMADISLRDQKAKAKPAGGADILKIIDQRDRLKEKARDEAGTLQTRLLARRKLGALDEQIKSAIEEASPKPGQKQPFDEDKNRPGIQAMPTLTNERKGPATKPNTPPTAPNPTTTQGGLKPAPDTPAPAPAPAPAPNTAADDAERLKLAEEQRQRDIADARAKELARRDEIRKRRGSGLESFLTSGLRGLPTTLGQILGV